ncbi:MAG: ATP-binding protein, partial [Phycisphaerales bacterium]
MAVTSSCRPGAKTAISPIRAEGCSREFVGIVRDITERKALQQRIREADRLATIGTLAAGLGHDMNNMLFPIRAHLNSIVTKASETGADQVREHAEQVGRGVLYLQQLADALHFLALDPDGDGDGDGDGTTDLASWWQTCGPLLGRAVHRRATISHEIAEGLPPVEIPQHALTRAVLNLLTNAADAMAPGRPVRQNHVKVSARLASSTASVILEVADNGVGMTEAVRRRATDMFFTTRTRGLGTGLGLALVNRVVERAGGRLEIVSSPGRGTTVRLLLPCASASESVDGREVKVDLHDGRTKAVVAAILESAGATVLEPGL